MNCPSCNKEAASFLRFSFSLQGVSFAKSIQGYLKCQNCGTLLRVTDYGKRFWILFATSIVVLALFVFLYQQLFLTVGYGITAAIWIILCLLISLTFTVGLWKFARTQKAEDSEQSATS